MSEYKSYLLRQLGIKESQFKPVDINPESIEPGELKQGISTEKEHTEDDAVAKKIALHHLGEDPNYYSRMEKCGLKEFSPFSGLMSPTAKSPSVLAIGIRGTPGGMMPTSLSPSDTAIAPEGAGVNPKSKAALGGLELVSRQTPNSTIVNHTPKNQKLNSSAPIANIGDESTPAEHPAQIQNIKSTGEGIPQSLLGVTADASAPMGNKPHPEQFETGTSEDETNIDIPQDTEDVPDDNNSSNIVPTEVDETFVRHKKLMREKLGVGECKPCGCNRPNTNHPKKTSKFTTEQLVSLREQFSNKSKTTKLTEQELEISNRINSRLKTRGL